MKTSMGPGGWARQASYAQCQPAYSEKAKFWFDGWRTQAHWQLFHNPWRFMAGSRRIWHLCTNSTWNKTPWSSPGNINFERKEGPASQQGSRLKFHQKQGGKKHERNAEQLAGCNLLKRTKNISSRIRSKLWLEKVKCRAEQRWDEGNQINRRGRCLRVAGVCRNVPLLYLEVISVPGPAVFFSPHQLLSFS